MERALIVGGTGMLAEVARTLSARGVATSVLARHVKRVPDGTHGIACDYRDKDAFVDAVRAAGPFDLAVVWIHSIAPDAPLALARVLTEPGEPVRYVHVLGSAAADPAAPDLGRRAAFESVPGVTYEEVILGFVPGRFGSRWLHHHEISDGVVGAVDTPAARTVVGQVEPWSARP
jgi:hypothetical protein